MAAVDRAKLKKIRWFSNGVWQFQPHLHYMQNMYKVEEDFAEKVTLMEVGGVIKKDNDWFKMELEEAKQTNLPGEK